MMRGSAAASAARNEPRPSLGERRDRDDPPAAAARRRAPPNRRRPETRAARWALARARLDRTPERRRRARTTPGGAHDGVRVIAVRDRRDAVRHDRFSRQPVEASILLMTPVSHTLEPARSRRRSEGVFVLEQTGARAVGAEVQAIAQRFVTARRTGEPLAGVSGPSAARPRGRLRVPGRRDRARGATRSPAGRSVSIGTRRSRRSFKQDRLAGPIFSSERARGCAPGEHVGVSGLRGRLRGRRGGVPAAARRATRRADKLDWTRAEARELVAAVHVGVETAGSPLATINDLGPTRDRRRLRQQRGPDRRPRAAATGARRPSRTGSARRSSTASAVGRGHGGVAPGGPFESLRFLLGSARGARARSKPAIGCRPARSRACTRSSPDRRARVSFDDAGEILCTAEPFIGGAQAGPRTPRRW